MHVNVRSLRHKKQPLETFLVDNKCMSTGSRMLDGCIPFFSNIQHWWGYRDCRCMGSLYHPVSRIHTTMLKIVANRIRTSVGFTLQKNPTKRGRSCLRTFSQNQGSNYKKLGI